MDPKRGGRERSVAEIAAGLVRRGHDVTVLCQSGSLGAAGVEVLELGSAGLGRSGQMASFVEAVGQAVRREGFDVVHATLPVPCANVYQPRGGTIPGQMAAKDRLAGPIGRLLRRIARPLNRTRQAARKRERQIAADDGVKCLAVSEMVAEEFAAYYGRRENVEVIYGGVEVPRIDDETRASWRTELRGRWGAGEETTVFLTVAQNFLLKGVAELIDAFAEFSGSRPDRPAKLVVVGGDDARAYRQRAAMAGVAEHVLFRGQADDVFPLYSAADAIVLLSWQDACSRVVLEAIRWGLPSLTTRFNGAAELLARGVGIVVESPRDRSGILAGLDQLADPAMRLRMSDACREAADFISVERHLDGLERVYREVAGR